LSLSAAPPPDPRWESVRADIQDGIVQVLERTGRFTDLTAREELVRLVAHQRGVVLGVAPVEHERTHLQFIVRACGARDCLSDLVEALEPYRLPEQVTWRLRQLNDEWDGLANVADPDRWLTIKDILEQVDVSNGLSLFRAVQWRNPPPAHCRSVWHLFAFLATSNSDVQGAPHFMTFLWLVADQLDRRSGRPLLDLLRRMASDWNITETFQRVSAARRREVGRSGENAALLILIEPHPLKDGLYTVVHWYGWTADRRLLIRGTDHEVGYDALQETVQWIVQSVESEWPTNDQRLHIEFILPFAMLNTPVEQWPKEIDEDDGPVPLYKHYSVVVRSLDRMRHPGRHRVWRARWDILTDSPTLAGCLYSQDVPHRLEEEITLDPRIVAVVLSEPPQHRRGEGMNEIRIAIRTGIPIIMWHRSEGPGSAFRRCVEESMHYGEIAILPDRVFELRLTNRGPDDERAEVGRNLVLLWDDPVRLPEEYRTAASGGGNSH
jgi:hypothetical protein